LLDFIERISPSEAPVLIGGETGTGKELVARHIHHLSGRMGPFLVVNCGAISEQLADSELFGHEAGAFTGAVGRREGWFEAANGGTLFMDEICDLPSSLQVKILRVLQEKEVVRIGSTKAIHVDVRLVAASNVDLESAVAAGNFRRDLFYRINIAQVKLTPLCERSGDILPLAEHFLKYYSKKIKREQPKLSREAIDLLLSYSWPGNIRELENVIHFALLVAGQEVINPKHLKVSGGWEAGTLNPSLRNASNKRQAKISNNKTTQIDHIAHEKHDDPMSIIGLQLTQLFEEIGGGPNFDKLERLIIHQAFSHVGSNQVHGAALLGISRNVMRTLLKRHGLLEHYSGEKGRSNNDLDVEDIEPNTL
jgi:transcriptional regulator with PAS, ATPase and Fis domain